MKKKHTGWAIKGNHGFYVGWWLTRADAIAAHCKALARLWEDCRAKGDRAIKIKISEVR